jgi:spermidine/putrescine transport system ATP-binding protein
VELKRIQKEVLITFIYVTHDQDEALTMSDRIAVMDQGRILQVGTPNEVYDEPDSRFVAGFVGVSNLLELEVESVQEGIAKLKLGPADHVAAGVGEHVRAGEVAIVTIRPERIAIAGDHPTVGEQDCRVSGTVRDTLYAGPVTRFVVALDGGGELMVVRQNARTGFQDAEALRGRQITLVWHRDHTRVISTTEERSTTDEETVVNET